MFKFHFIRILNLPAWKRPTHWKNNGDETGKQRCVLLHTAHRTIMSWTQLKPHVGLPAIRRIGPSQPWLYCCLGSIRLESYHLKFKNPPWLHFLLWLHFSDLIYIKLLKRTVHSHCLQFLFFHCRASYIICWASCKVKMWDSSSKLLRLS